MKTSTVAILSFFALLLTIPAVISAQACDRGEIQPAVQKAKSIQSELLAFKLRDEMDEEVPPSLQAQIRSFKSTLTVFADQVLACTPSSADLDSVRSTMARHLNANKPEPPQQVYYPKKPPQLDHIYGDSLKVKVTAPANIPHILLIDFSFVIGCGYDSMLLVYEQRDGKWKRTLQWQSADYDSVAGAFGDFFQYATIPQPETNTWLIAVAHGHPWCTSRWSAFDLDLLQPTASSNAPNLLQHINQGYVRFEIEPVLKPVAGGFQLRLQTGMIDMDLMTRIGIYRYSIEGTKIDRIQPIANNGRDFVDEWLQSPWSDASRWSSPSNLASLKRVHTEIHEDVNSSSANTLFTFGPVRTCSDARSHLQVELDEQSSGDKGKLQPGEATYFQIRQGHNSFTMLSASAEPDPHCTRPDIMPKQ